MRVRAAGVNPVDTYIRGGGHAVKPQLPYTPGLDAAGTVEAAGDGVERVRAGDRVYTAGSVSGTYAELALCDESQVHALPERVSFAQGAGGAGAIGSWVSPFTVVAAGIGMALAGGLCGLGQGRAIAAALEGIARQPGAAARIQTAMIIGLALIESLAIYTLVIALILLFVKGINFA